MSNTIKVKPLSWSEPQAPNSEISYDHVFAETPFGRILITWKGWKENPSFDVDESPWPDNFKAFFSLEEAKMVIEKEFCNRLLACLLT